MIDEKALTGGLVGTSISASGVLFSATELALWVSIVVSVLGLIVTIVSTIVIPLAQGKKIEQEDLDTLTERIDDTAKKMDEIAKGENDDKAA